MSWPISLCDGCVHRTSEQRCKAFPEGIPNRYYTGEAYHTKLEPGDHGLVFIPVDEAWKETAAELLDIEANPEAEGEGEPMP